MHRLLEQGHPIDAAEDHESTVSLYLPDPDDNGIELYDDRPCQAWFDPQGEPILKAEPAEPYDIAILLGGSFEWEHVLK